MSLIAAPATPTIPHPGITSIHRAYAYHRRGNLHLRRSFYLIMILCPLFLVGCGFLIGANAIYSWGLFAPGALLMAVVSGAIGWALYWWRRAYRVLLAAGVLGRGEWGPGNMEGIFKKHLGGREAL